MTLQPPQLERDAGADPANANAHPKAAQEAALAESSADDSHILSLGERYMDDANAGFSVVYKQTHTQTDHYVQGLHLEGGLLGMKKRKFDRTGNFCKRTSTNFIRP